MITKEAHMGWKIITGSDNAGYGHKSALKELLETDPRVEEVVDVGVTGREDGTYYPNVAVEAAIATPRPVPQISRARSASPAATFSAAAVAMFG